MTFRYSTLIIAAYLYADIFCIYALPVRPERQTSGSRDLEWMMKSSLIALRDTANHGLPKNPLRFSEACHLLDNLKEVNNDALQECQENISNWDLHSIRSVIGSLLSASGWNLLKEDGSCSDSTLDLFRTKIKLVHDTDSAQNLLNVRYDECIWVDEIFEEEPSIPQEIKDSIHEKLMCRPPKQ